MAGWGGRIINKIIKKVFSGLKINMPKPYVFGPTCCIYSSPGSAVHCVGLGGNAQSSVRISVAGAILATTAFKMNECM